jgi:hypothetical protein
VDEDYDNDPARLVKIMANIAAWNPAFGDSLLQQQDQQQPGPDQQQQQQQQAPEKKRRRAEGSDSSAKRARVADRDSFECVVCMDKPRTHVFVACFHFVVCSDCADAITGTSGLCPVCREQSETKHMPGF